MNRMEIFQEVYGKDYVFTETELSQLLQVAELIVRECAPIVYDGLDLEAMKGVNRFEVIDKSGRAYVKYLKNDERVKYGLQDDDRTLKVFIQDNLEYE